MSYTYDGSLPKSVTWSGEVNGTVGVTYDNNMRVTQQTVNGGNAVNFSYDNDGLLTQAGDLTITREPATGRISGTTLGNVTTSQAYNNLGELSSYQAKYGSNTIFSTNYQRDSLGRITELRETVNGGSEKKNYAYDIAGRLESVWRNDTLVSTYSYDPNGNRISHWTPAKIDSGSYDAQDRLLSITQSPTGTIAQYIYTANGELSKKIEGADTTTYTYDYFGNLITVVLPRQTDGGQANQDRIDYIIDGQNRRIGKKVNGRVVKRWIYSGQLSPVAELDSAGNIVARFVGGYMVKGGNTYQLITDHLGSVRLVVDVNSGTVVQRLEYDEYGNILTNTNTDFTPFGFCGGLYDSQTKLTRFGARDYDASVGRWLSKDPIGCLSNSPNFYEYAQNNPITYTDPDGLQLIPVGPSPIIQRGIEEVGNFFGAIGDFMKNYRDLREANATQNLIGSDKYFHCKANCEASKRGLGGYLAAAAISEGRELFDEHIKGYPRSDCNTDRAANKQGRDGKEPSCSDRCNSLRPRGLNPKY